MNELDTNLLLQTLKSDKNIRHDFLRSFATSKELNDSFDEANKAYRSLNEKLDFNVFKSFLSDKDFQICEQVIIKVLDSSNVRLTQWAVKEFMAFYIYRTITQERPIGRANGSWGSIIYEKYYYGDLPAA